MMPEEACLRGDLGLVKRLIAANASAGGPQLQPCWGVATDFSGGNAMAAEMKKKHVYGCFQK